MQDHRRHLHPKRINPVHGGRCPRPLRRRTGCRPERQRSAKSRIPDSACLGRARRGYVLKPLVACRREGGTPRNFYPARQSRASPFERIVFDPPNHKNTTVPDGFSPVTSPTHPTHPTTRQPDVHESSFLTPPPPGSPFLFRWPRRRAPCRGGPRCSSARLLHAPLPRQISSAVASGRTRLPTVRAAKTGGRRTTLAIVTRPRAQLAARRRLTVRSPHAVPLLVYAHALACGYCTRASAF